jgi:hypothetical protein
MQPIKKILYAFTWCKSYIENQKRWNIFKDFITCLLLEKQGYPDSPYCTNRKNQVRVNMHWLISQLHLKICCHFLPAFANFTPCSITPSDQKTKFVIFYRHMQLPQLFQSHNVTGIKERPIRGFHCTQLGTSSWHKGKC